MPPTFWKRLPTFWLNALIQTFSVIAIFFEGYDQGVMGGVNASPDYVVTVGIGTEDGTITSTIHEGGIVSCYYLGAIVGCFAGGWLADRIGRINGIFLGSLIAMTGGALQAAAQSSNFMIIARVYTGVGTGALTGIVPVYCSEVATASHRGAFLGYVFIANYLGISVAYWLAFGLAYIDNGFSAIRWRLPLAFQCFPALVLALGIKFLPDSPRYLASVGRNEEALEVLQHVRGCHRDDPKLQLEYAEMMSFCTNSKPSSPTQFLEILLGRSKEGALGRRAWLCVWLQVMASWTGITAVTAYSPTLLRQAGYSSTTQNGLAGGINTIGIVGTVISAHIVDRFGRRKCLIGGSVGLVMVNTVAAAIYEVTRSHPGRARDLAPPAVSMLFLFNLTYAATWGTIAFLIPTELFPANLRAQGNGFGISGWAIAVGWTTLANPVMFNSMGSRTYFLFAGLNLLWIPFIYFFYPETADRSLESIGALFASSSPFNWSMERSYRDREAVPDPVAGAPSSSASNSNSSSRLDRGSSIKRDRELLGTA